MGRESARGIALTKSQVKRRGTRERTTWIYQM